MRRISLILAIGLVAAACGGAETTLETRADGGASIEVAGSGTQSPVETSPTTNGPALTSETTTNGPPAALPDSDYPNVVVDDLAGGEFNLRELALESNPVLLWFWAPH